MKRRHLLIIPAVVLLLVSGYLIFGYITFMNGEMCGNDILEELVAPEGSMKVVKFQRDCGATTGFSTQVSLLSIDADLPNEGGNVFVVDTDHGKVPAGDGEGPEVSIVWISKDTLLIEHHPLVRIFENVHEMSGIKIIYTMNTDS